MKYFKFLGLLLLMSCSTSKVIVDYDSQIDFQNFDTFNYYEDVGKGLNELDIKRVTTILSNELKALGLEKAENPKFYINIISKISDVANNNTIGIGIGSGGRNGGFGVSGGIPIGSKKVNETIKIEFVNADTNSLIWEANLTSTIKEKRSPEEKEEHFTIIIKKIIEKYPPQKKSSKN